MMRPTSAAWMLPLLIAALPLTAAAQAAPTDANAQSLQQFYDRVRPALVAVKYQWQGELAKQELVGSGVVVSDDGLVMIPLLLTYTFIPDAQMKDFKIIIPSDTDDQTEVDAAFVGRDERSNVAFVKAANSDRKWTSIHFEDRPLAVGQKLYGVGILPKAAGYRAYLTEATVSARLRGEVPQVLIAGGLANAGSPVFDADFHAVGLVGPQDFPDVLLDGRNELTGIVTPPHFFVPTRFFQLSLDDPITSAQPLRTPWMGVPSMKGLNEQTARFLGLKNQPAVQVGDVVPGTPAAKAGLHPGDIIIKMDGQPLDRGDLADELPLMLRRRLIRMKIGQKVTFTVMTDKDSPTKDITITLSERPRQSNLAERFYAQDLGFVAREAVFTDTYEHKLKPDAVGVVVDLVRRDGAAATAKLGPGDWVMQLNGQSVTDLRRFRTDYELFRKEHAHDAVVLVVHRRSGREETINIEPPQSDTPPG